MRVTVNAAGDKAAIGALASLNGGAMPAMSAALFKAAELASAGAKRLVPVDKGALRSSIHVEGPKLSRTSTEVSVVAGGPSAHYAIYVHEDLTMNHPNGGQAKFIEAPVLGVLPLIPAMIVHEVEKRTRR